MIILDSHIWIWWVDNNPRLTEKYRNWLEENQSQLTGFHRDPSDQIIVATARIYRCPLLTADAKILAYPDVQTLK